MTTDMSAHPAPEFIYFDLGNVLLYFDHGLACRQMADVAGVDAETVRRVVFESGLKLRYEAGEISRQQFYDEFCQATDTRPDYNALERAGSAIFELNVSIVPVVAHLWEAGYRLGMLSNTSPCHYRYFADGRYRMIPEAFETIVLSYEVGVVKPDAKIFHAAIGRAGVPPERIFYVDDVSGHVDAARRRGIDAMQYTTTADLVAELRRRGVRFNY
jgi:putative hydrolase of the HAD superfamily